MTYRGQIVGLSQECERRVLAVYVLFTAGQISAEETATVMAMIVAAHLHSGCPGGSVTGRDDHARARPPGADCRCAAPPRRR